MKRIELKKLIEECIIETLAESKSGPKIETLKKNKRPLTPEEREIVMRSGAVWYHGAGGSESPAIQKAIVNDKTWYWCATHRCGQVRPTLKGVIKAFEFVKTTA